MVDANSKQYAVLQGSIRKGVRNRSDLLLGHVEEALAATVVVLRRTVGDQVKGCQSRLSVNSNRTFYKTYSKFKKQYRTCERRRR